MKKICLDKNTCKMLVSKLTDKGITISELNKTAGLTVLETNDLQEGKVALSLSKVHNLAVLIDMPISELLFEIDRTPLTKYENHIN